METWPFWLLFLGTAVVALLVVNRLDDVERGAASRARKAKDGVTEERT